ncbi:hypothetical protein C482_13525 [Natrialba chahannaoensis JCM 10990]|uniref:DUF7344 domain-containing protein n=2 Tax=Natrialba chahannaoensis TaxID=68911 RepID=M0AH71_9EURY|nr:hypothetical protein C482_13525 [Natrialba chahannaoensis JCM 10990]
MEAACSLLSKLERRYLLYQLSDGRRANIDDLIDQIAAWELEGDGQGGYDAVDEETRQQVYISLIHNHLPRLADYEIIDYDLRSGDIVLDDGFEDIKPLLEQFRQTEEHPELRKRATL